MEGKSKLIMGATLVMMVSLAMVLALLIVLLAELYCSLLLRRDRRSLPMTITNPSPTPIKEPSSGPLTSSTVGVLLNAPRNFLFPTIMIPNVEEPPKTQTRIQESVQGPATFEASSSYTHDEHFIYISNPIYDNETCSKLSKVCTPFETPETSPSHLEMGSWSSEDDDESINIKTPPLTPMKKLPVEGCSVSLRDARFLATSGSGSDSNQGLSSSSSGSPCTSPSW
ncbi:hypothetical protein GIB67_011105 [Kingdonia uniflora]|uniref:Uncharacterized protein n=1 Tax=Kingdonia uniflora TaxID=39325 RepID=A0A7J7PA79_9MAGN|nr:hypothetical protein GIB67_011105 [Kingdonia uniflora]